MLRQGSAGRIPMGAACRVKGGVNRRRYVHNVVGSCSVERRKKGLVEGFMMDGK